MAYNCYGEILKNTRPVIASKDFVKKDSPKGNPIPNWLEDDGLTVDGDGMDRTHVEPNGEHTMVVELPKGTMLCRYGAIAGRQTAPVGTPYEMLSLPYVKETVEYHEYEVIADGVFVRCFVVRGMTAPMFGSKGGAIAYIHEESVLTDINNGKIKEVMTWLTK